MRQTGKDNGDRETYSETNRESQNHNKEGVGGGGWGRDSPLSTTSVTSGPMGHNFTGVVVFTCIYLYFQCNNVDCIDRCKVVHSFNAKGNAA